MNLSLLRVIAALGFCLSACIAAALADPSTPFRPPAVPLVASDPYLSIWSESDTLSADCTRHWTGHPASLDCLVRVDGAPFRLMGRTPVAAPALPQTGVTVLPTRTIYRFANREIRVSMTFLSPALPTDLSAYSLPLAYIVWQVRSVDGKRHDVSVYLSASSEIAVDTPSQKVDWARRTDGPLTILKVGTVDQTYFEPAGDDTRIDWGYAYLAARSRQAVGAIGDGSVLSARFAAGGRVGGVDARMPRAVSDDTPVMALDFPLGAIGRRTVSRRALLAYDEIYSIDFFGERLRPYWKRSGESAPQMLLGADRQYSALAARCGEFDRKLMADLTRVGGAKYARIAALAYRQCVAGCGLAADRNGKPLLLTKENTSNGDIATVDVIYPMDPVWILLSPTLAKASLVADLDYAASPHWKFPNAPHDLGTYPVAMGRDNGGEGMPVEESGNMIILCDAIAHDDGNADFASRWWPQISGWAHYLERYGLDPGNQLCTDDFMGHLAHNANLSVKAIVALAAYGDLCRMRGSSAEAEHFHHEAVADARHWVSVCDSGTHSTLAFDKPGTWSQKYNLVWDKILGLDVFAPSVAAKESAFYQSVLQPYGLPLDSRTLLTKTDWSLWSATLATDPRDFRNIVSRIYAYLDTTTSRVPLVDSYTTDDPDSSGMHARPVVGGIFIKMLSDPAIWRKWAAMDHRNMSGWADLPPAETIVQIAPSSQQSPQIWRYTTTAPVGNGWTKPGFDDSGWSVGPGGFGTVGTPGAVIGTTWSTDDIWLRRTVTLPKTPIRSPVFWVYHDEDVQIFVDGILAAFEPGYVPHYESLAMRPEAGKLIKPGATVTLAVHCHQTVGGQDIDVGIVRIRQPWNTARR